MAKQIVLRDQADGIAQALDDSLRATADSAQLFIEPRSGVLTQVTSRRHIVIYGRRGSGKSSLLYKLQHDAQAARQPCALVDLESVKGLEYPDVLIVVLQRTLRALQVWLDTSAVAPRNALFWKKRALTPDRIKKALPRKRAKEYSARLGEEIAHLEDLLNRPLDAAVVSTRQRSRTRKFSAGANVDPVDVQAASEHANNVTLQRNFVETKIQDLNRALAGHQELVRELSELAEMPTLILLDDLYHVPRSSQPYVLDYFHRLCKGLPVYMKVGTIRNRSRIYQGGDPPIGIEFPHDAGAIDLDRTLADFQGARSFLLDVADSVLSPVGVRARSLATTTAYDRLTLASGGVARDFLSMLSSAVQLAKVERPKAMLNVTAPEINSVAGDLESLKRDDLARDIAAGEDSGHLLKVLDEVRAFCYEQNSNCFLLEQDAPQEKAQPVRELIDMRLVHDVRARVTIRSRPGRIYEAYILDISQWTGQRKRRNFEEIKFWTNEGAQKLRHARLVFAARE